MITLPGYRLLDTIIENNSWTLYKAYSTKDKKLVAIKWTNNEWNDSHTNAEIIHDYHVAKNLATDHVLRPLMLESYGEQTYIITEFFSGTTLQDRLKSPDQSTHDLASYLKIAAGISGIVAMIHQEHIIHKSLQSQNILLNEQTNEIKLTGFQQATKLSSEMQHPNISPYQLRERVAYMSPEQTGRMNKSLDYRTDLYSLGVIFYELFTGELPFKADHPAEMLHAHLAKVPPFPSSLNKEIPKPVSSIIMRLLEKAPESRYQSAYGLKEDLEQCINQLNQTGEIKPFQLRERDTKILIESPGKLYGREEAIRQLVAGFHRIGEGDAELLLIPGPSGIGKSVLVDELHKPLIREKGYFISGKFVQLKRQIPYAPLIQAFQGLLRQILSEGQESIQKWRDKLTVELASYAGVIANFIPEVNWLIGPQIDISELPPQGVHNRFRNAIRQFVGVFAKEEHPLVLFIDDLQWADHATLDLIQYLLSNPEKQHFLIIGAFRDNEVQVGHPLEMMLEDLKEEAVQITNIPIGPLNYSHVYEWTKRILSIKGNDTAFLAELVYRITQGNPFFMVQLFQSFHDEQIISFHPKKAKWVVQEDLLNQIPMSDTIIDFILKRINKLPKGTKQILELASCFGNHFDLKSLATITNTTYEEIANSLWQGLEDGLILPLDASYKWVYPNENKALLNEHPPSYYFLHDKVQQAFYSSLSKEVRETNHLKIGQELANFYHADQQEEHIFEIVNHLNHCHSRLSVKQKLILVEWNGMAGERSKKRAAQKAALNYFSIGKKLLPHNDWVDHYESTFKIMIGLGEAQYLNLLFEKAEKTFDETIAHARTYQEKLRVYNLKITLYTHIHEVKKATNAGLDGLRLLGLNIKMNPRKWEVAKEYLLTKRALNRKKDADLLALPAVMEEDPKLIMRTMINTNAPAYHVDQNLATILMLRALRLTLAYGDMDVTALVYNNYALTLSAGFNDYEASYKFGKLAIEHAEKYEDNSLKARVYFVFGSFVNHWKDHIRYNIDYLERSQQLCIESGNLHLAGANASFIGLTLFIKGGHLKGVAEGIERQLRFAKLNEYVLTNDFLAEVMDWLQILTMKNKKMNWEYAVFTDDPSATIIHNTIRLQMTYLFQQEDQAIAIMEELESLVDDKLILVIAPEYYFYYALWTARLIRTGKVVKSKGKANILKKLARLKKWAEHSPKNYLHKYLLVKAELFRTDKRASEAIHLYDRAARQASENGFLQDAALANECTAYYYLDEKLSKSAKAYMVDAYNNYLKWGANRLANDLYQKYPELLGESEKSAPDMVLEKESLDINAIFEAAGVVSSEMNLNQLLGKLMHIVVTNAGAEHAFLLLNREDKLRLAATNHLNEEVTIYDHPEVINETMDFSISIVNYVVNTKEAVVLGEAADKGEFTEDLFVKQQKAKSILCLPILYQGRLTGVLYLRNNQSANVFTKDRLVLLTLLASQAAISIENAYLYGSLEAKVDERTTLLNAANQSLTTANQSLAHSKEVRRQLLANISHDLRSPIATIQGYVDAILDGLVESPDQQEKYLHVVKKRLTSLNGLVQDLFDLARLESGQVSFSMDIVPIDQLFTHLCGQFEMEIKQAGLDYFRDLPLPYEDEYPLVEVDVRRMEQVMSNLVVNAIKHTREGQIRIGLSLINKGEAIMSVEDQGSGIPASELPYVFDRFYTKSNGRKDKGNGLGLAISKEIITIHQGKMWVESEEGTGTKFYFLLQVF